MQITTSLNKNSTQTHINQTKNLFCSGKELSVSWASKFQVLFIVRASLSRALNKIVPDILSNMSTLKLKFVKIKRIS